MAEASSSPPRDAQAGVRSIGEAVGRLIAAHKRVPLLDPLVDMKVGRAGGWCWGRPAPKCV